MTIFVAIKIKIAVIYLKMYPSCATNYRGNKNRSTYKIAPFLGYKKSILILHANETDKYKLPSIQKLVSLRGEGNGDCTFQAALLGPTYFIH